MRCSYSSSARFSPTIGRIAFAHAVVLGCGWFLALAGVGAVQALAPDAPFGRDGGVFREVARFVYPGALAVAVFPLIILGCLGLAAIELWLAREAMRGRIRPAVGIAAIWAAEACLAGATVLIVGPPTWFFSLIAIGHAIAAVAAVVAATGVRYGPTPGDELSTNGPF